MRHILKGVVGKEHRTCENRYENVFEMLTVPPYGVFGIIAIYQKVNTCSDIMNITY